MNVPHQRVVGAIRRDRPRTTNQPFCALSRASNNITEPLSEVIVTRVCGSSGASTMLCPLAIGTGCATPLESRSIGPLG
jgi:hypothetical protein